MALINCKECQKQISETAVGCPHCGAPMKAQRPPMVRPIFVALLFILIGSIALLAFIGRGGPTAVARTLIGDQIVIDRYDTLRDGYRLSWKLEAGMYRVELTSDGDGVLVDWVAANCPKAATETKIFHGVCELPGIGQLVITNPTVFGLGQASNVTLKVTRLRF